MNIFNHRLYILLHSQLSAQNHRFHQAHSKDISFFKLNLSFRSELTLQKENLLVISSKILMPSL